MAPTARSEQSVSIMKGHLKSGKQSTGEEHKRSLRIQNDSVYPSSHLKATPFYSKRVKGAAICANYCTN